MTLQRSLMALVAIALFAGLIPLAVVLDQRLETALEQRAREDLELAPLVLESRVQDLAGGRMMHAKELGATAGLAAALANGDHERAESLLAAAPGYPGERPLLVGPGGESLMGPLPPTALLDQTRNGEVVELEWEGDRYLLRTALMDDARVTFVRNLNDEMAIVPELRRAGLMLLMATLAFALVVGGAFASRLARPIGALASAADRLAAGDFDTPVPGSAIQEVEQVREAFNVMRIALAERMHKLQEANRELADGQARRGALQAELIQRDRLAAAGRLLTTLAHEIRNPVANVRNCLERSGKETWYTLK